MEILYHNSEHLDPTLDSTKALVQRRNVIGRSTGAPVEILPLPDGLGKRTAHNTPEGTTEFYAYIRFAANKDGEFTLLFGDKEIRLDLSLDDNAYF